MVRSQGVIIRNMLFATSTITSLEGISYIAEVVSSLSIVFIACQVLISLQDIRTRSKREAGLISLNQADKFADEIIPLTNKIRKVIESNGVKIPEFELLSREEVRKKLKQSSELKKLTEIIFRTPDLDTDVRNLTNKVEAFAIVFISKMGDEEVVFPSVAQPYCEIFKQFSWAFSLSRKEDKDDQPFSATIKLYKHWLKRLKKNEISKKISELSDDVRKLEESSINPIGTK